VRRGVLCQGDTNVRETLMRRKEGKLPTQHSLLSLLKTK
jgi:hypothetical protein